MFQQRGYSGTTVRDLAREIGITSGSIFHHFGTKEEVLICVVDEGLRHATERMSSTQAAGAEPHERVRDMIHAHLSALLDGSPETASVLFSEWWSLTEPGRRQIVEMRDAYEQLWDSAMAALGGRYADPVQRKLLRLLLFGAMNWSAQWYRSDGEFDVDDITAMLVDVYLQRRAGV